MTEAVDAAREAVMRALWRIAQPIDAQSADIAAFSESMNAYEAAVRAERDAEIARLVAAAERLQRLLDVFPDGFDDAGPAAMDEFAAALAPFTEKPDVVKEAEI